MKISTRGEYGLRAMLYIAGHAQGEPVTAAAVARAFAVGRDEEAVIELK